MEEGPARKKLLPASCGVTGRASRMVKWPIPGRTRFLRIEVDVADPEMTRTRAFSRAVWPVAAQRLGYIVVIFVSNHPSAEGLTVVDDRIDEFYCLVVL